MDTWSSSEVAGWLGVSVPAVHRAVARLGLDPVMGARGLRFDSDDIAALTRDVGSVPTIEGLSRQDVQVLVALSHSPLGLRSVRAVARRAHVSPTTASLSLAALRSMGLVAHERRMFAEGRAVEGDLWKLDYVHPLWQEIAPIVASTVLPTGEPAAGPRAQPKRVPLRLHHHFWNTTPGKLSMDRDGDYITTRLLLSGDPQAAAWVAANATPSNLAAAARNRGADSDVRQMAKNFAAAS